MWYLLYNMVLVVSSPIIILVLLLKKRCRRGFSQRIGLRLPAPLPPDTELLWVHAVSMGEVVAVTPLVKTIHQAYPDLAIFVSTITETGREAVEQRLAGIARHGYLPLDWPWAVRRLISRLRPKVFIVIETELWPNLLKELHEYGTACVLVNGRLSSTSFQRYRWVTPFMKTVLSSLTLCLMQTERDVERILALGGPAERVHGVGNVKFDADVLGFDKAKNTLSRENMGLQDDEALIVAGSTHPKEEEILLSSYKILVRDHPKAVLLLAPRHIERSNQLAMTIQSFGLTPIRRSESLLPDRRFTFEKGPRVILLDTRGELAQIYALAEVTFVGGTLVPVGGHNLLEPAFWGKPVLFGPFTDHCQEIADSLVESGGGRRVKNEQDLIGVFNTIMSDQSLRERMGKAAYDLILKNQGVVSRLMTLLRPLLESQESGKAVVGEKRRREKW